MPRGRHKTASLHPTTCKISGCESPHMGTKYSRLCKEHYACGAGDSTAGRCIARSCNAPRCQPYAHGLCEKHHPGKQLSTQEEILLKGKLEGKSPRALAQEVGIHPTNVIKKLDTPLMRAAAATVLTDAGVNIADAVRALDAALHADKIVLHRDPETGEVKPMVIGPDHVVRCASAVDLLKFTIGYAAVKVEQDVVTKQETLVILPPKQAIPLNAKVIEINTEKDKDKKK